MCLPRVARFVALMARCVALLARCAALAALVAALVSLAVLYRLSLRSVSMLKSPDLVYILLWTSRHTEPMSNIGNGTEIFVARSCPVQKCFTTADRALLSDITEFDVVLFHGMEIVHRGRRGGVALPTRRAPRQRYVFASTESAGYYPVWGAFDDYFNITWTYRTDSDIFFGYMVIRDKSGQMIGPRQYVPWLKRDEMLPASAFIKNKIANKSIAAAWFVSNCRTPSGRQRVAEEISNEMKEYQMTLDVFGTCGAKSCPKDRDDCFDLIHKNYYFYFAFENSFAEDYVTEKLMIALKHYAVPVVFGGADYTRFMPDGAYLNARTLDTTELVRQMFEIISDPERYHAYFMWHNHYSYELLEDSPATDPFCALCEHLNRNESQNDITVLHDFEDWWNNKIDVWPSGYGMGPPSDPEVLL